MSETGIAGKGKAWLAETQKMRAVMELRDYCPYTIYKYGTWLTRFLKFTGETDINKAMVPANVEAFLEQITEEGSAHVTRQQAYYALHYYAANILQPPRDVVVTDRVQQPIEILSDADVAKILLALSNNPIKQTLVSLIYGCGLRVSEVVSLRLCDFNFEQQQIVLDAGFYRIPRVLPMPKTLVATLEAYHRQAIRRFMVDESNGFRGVWMSDDFREQHNADPREVNWQYFFPAKKMGTDETGAPVWRKPRQRDDVTGALQVLSKKTKIKATVQGLRRTHLIRMVEMGYSLEEIQTRLDYRLPPGFFALASEHYNPDGKREFISPLDSLYHEFR